MKNSGRKTIGVLMDYMTLFSGAYDAEFRNAFESKCSELDLNLLLVYAGALGDPRRWSLEEKNVFHLMDRHYVDGLVFLSSCLASIFGADGVEQLIQYHGALPLCSLGVRIPGTPSVVVDNREGMEALVEHVVVTHGHRRPAFVAGTRGNPEAEARFTAYRTVLERHGIAFDEALVETGNFLHGEGQSATERILSRTSIDAVVCANDGMAFGAIQALRKRGYRVPRDIAVTGFDDVTMARLDNPPLTTVAQPFQALANEAIRIVLEQIEGRAVPECVELPATFVVRNSCGCGEKTRTHRSQALSEAAPGAAAHLRTHVADLTDKLANAMRLGSKESALLAAELLTAFEAALEGRPEPFLRAIDASFAKANDLDETCQAIETAIATLREEFAEYSIPELEDIWHQARDLVALHGRRARVEHRVNLDNDYVRMLEANRHIWRAVDLPSLKEALLKTMPRSGISTAFLSRYADESGLELEPLICLVEGRPCEPPPGNFAAHRLVPPGIYPQEERYCRLVFPLLCEEQRWGVAVFGYAGRSGPFQVFQDQVNVALGSIKVQRELLEKTMLHERSIQERQATADRMQALSVLAGGVAHDLNNVLGPMVALPDVILKELGDFAPELSPALTELRVDVETIKGASLRAAETIKDLLTLGRQGRMGKELLDLNTLAAHCLTVEPLRFMSDALKRISVTFDLCRDALVVRASEAHLVRAIANLVRNAVEAIDGSGRVIVGTRAVDVTEALPGYETVQPGQYAVVSVSDTGQGIAAADLARVFEPFFTKKRAKDSSGSGLGLAIVHGVVKEHAGYVDVTSDPGHGTTFSLYFPRMAAAPLPKATTSQAPAGRAKILIVDDEPMQLRTARRVLVQLGYEVDTLASGAEACEVFRDYVRTRDASAAGASPRVSPYELLIVDMTLNEPQDGLSVIEYVQTLIPGQRAMIASGLTATERGEAAMLRGLGWLLKPFTSGALARAVQTALAGRASP